MRNLHIHQTNWCSLNYHYLTCLPHCHLRALVDTRVGSCQMRGFLQSMSGHRPCRIHLLVHKGIKLHVSLPHSIKNPATWPRTSTPKTLRTPKQKTMTSSPCFRRFHLIRRLRTRYWSPLIALINAGLCIAIARSGRLCRDDESMFCAGWSR